MAKDPAFLFYHHDFLVGTHFMTNEEVGCYIRVLCYLADKSRLSYAQLNKICGTGELTDSIIGKLEKDTKGIFYNKRLLEEVEKRKSFCESRRKSRMSHVSESNDSHTVNVNENRNVNIKDDRVQGKKERKKRPQFVPPTLEEVKKYFLERKTKIDPETFHAHYKTNGWRQASGLPIIDWKSCVTTWEKRQRSSNPSVAPQSAGKPLAEVAVLELVALKWDDRQIKEHLIEKGYSEHRIVEAIMKARGSVR